MKDIQRQSPVVFEKKAIQTEKRGEWTVVLAYENQGAGPFLIDLSHIPRWDLQDGNLDRLKPFDRTLPTVPGNAVLKNNMLIHRMNRTQASLWILNGNDMTELKDPACTETTDATVLLALLGKDIFRIAEKVSPLDFLDPEKPDPCLFQGPLNHVPCQTVWIDRFSDSSCMLLTCSRGYARDMVQGLLEAGSEFGLTPAGEATFGDWLKNRKPIVAS